MHGVAEPHARVLRQRRAQHEERKAYLRGWSMTMVVPQVSKSPAPNRHSFVTGDRRGRARAELRAEKNRNGCPWTRGQPETAWGARTDTTDHSSRTRGNILQN